MEKITRDKIARDHRTGEFSSILQMRISDKNPQIVRARCELFMRVMDGLTSLIDAEAQWFNEVYGEKIVQAACEAGVYGENTDGPTVDRRVQVDSQVIGDNLLSKIPKGD